MDPVDPAHAPWPRNEGERLVFAQLYEPLLRVDCTGAIVAGLARSWLADSSTPARTTTWTLVLRDGARFTDGERVTPASVIASWRSSAAAHAGEPSGALIASVAAGARPRDDSTLVVTLPDSLASPTILASAALAVARRSDDLAWPDGTTSYHVDSATGGERAATPRAITLRSSTAAPSLLFQPAARRDERDILDAGVDLLRTASPAAVQYAATQSDRASTVLPWSRTYVLALPTRAAVAVTDSNCVEANARAFRAALARAVHGAARGAEQPFWWTSSGAPHSGMEPATLPCPAIQSESSQTASSAVGAGDRDDVAPRRLVYLRDDATARELAERIVALAAPGRGDPAQGGLPIVAPEMLGAGGWRAVGLDSLQFAQALAAGDEPAYVLALVRRPTSIAFATTALLAAAPWFAPLAAPAARIVPLVDTRETLIARRSSALPTMTVDWDGTLILGGRQHAVAEGTP